MAWQVAAWSSSALWRTGLEQSGQWTTFSSSPSASSSADRSASSCNTSDTSCNSASICPGFLERVWVSDLLRICSGGEKAALLLAVLTRRLLTSDDNETLLAESETPLRVAQSIPLRDPSSRRIAPHSPNTTQQPISALYSC